jgi:flavin-dependent dehydrogenase
MSSGRSTGHDYDVVIVGGGPAGATMATLLTQRRLRVAVFERERFPRFQVGESLLPANMPIFERLGCHDALRQAGFVIKPGATFYDEYEGRGRKTILFGDIPLRPAYAYNVTRAEFDTVLLHHARRQGAVVYEQHAAERVTFETDGIQLWVREPPGTLRQVRAQCLVDASGRAAFLGGRLGSRAALPGLGRVALFAHVRGTHRESSVPEGNIRIHIIRDGWLWYIPFADGTDSIGCVLHASVAKQRQGSVEELFDAVTASAPRFAERLTDAQRITPVYSAANFSYRIAPAIGERFVVVGDAHGFVDPVFSTGVFLAMRSAELAAEAIWRAFQRQDFGARRFRQYETQFLRGIAPLLAFIRHFYDPAFLDLFFASHPPLRLYQAVLWVLSGAAFDRRPAWVRANLALFRVVVTLRKAVRRISGQPAASRWRW